MNKEQSAQFLALALKSPCIAGQYITGKLRAGSKINEKSGKKESYAGYQSSILIGGDVVTVVTYENDEAKVQQLVQAAEAGNHAPFLPAKAGEFVAIELNKLTREKGLTLCTGHVHPLR
jgi:hypothetical protein